MIWLNLKENETSAMLELLENKDLFDETVDLYKTRIRDYTISVFNNLVNSKENRYLLLSVISFEEIQSKENYLDQDSTNEALIFTNHAKRLDNFIQRFMKFVYELIKNKGVDVDSIESLFKQNDGYLSFNHPNESRSCILLPNFDSDRASFESFLKIISRLKSNPNRPDVWYFRNLDSRRVKLGKNHTYDIDCCKPNMLINQPTRPVKDKFFVECLACLETDSSYECSEVDCIFKRGGCRYD